MDTKDKLIEFWSMNKHIGIGTLLHILFIHMVDSSDVKIRDKTILDWFYCSLMSITIGLVSAYIAIAWFSFQEMEVKTPVVIAFSATMSALGYRGLSYLLIKINRVINILIRKL